MAEKGSQQRKVVCIFEDDQDLQSLYATKFKNNGFHVCTASNGTEALKLLKKKSPDLVILDLLMPETDGFTVLRKAKHDENLKNIPIFVLTNLSQNADIEEGKRLDADRYFIKMHYTPEEVVEKVEEYLNNN